MAHFGKGRDAGVDLNLGIGGDQQRLMERLNLPLLNVHCDEVPFVKGKSPGGQSSTPGNASSKNKRPIGDSHQEVNKKRFVWPDALHRDFLAAVFDIGLKYASPKEVALLMAEDDNSVSMEQMKSHIQKFMMFRERKEGEYVSYSDQDRGVLPARPSYTSVGSYDAPSHGASTSNANTNNFDDITGNAIKSDLGWNDSASATTSIPAKNSIKNGHDKRANTNHLHGRPNTSIPPTQLLAKIDTMGEAINAQSAHLANIKQLIKRQTKLFVLLSQKAAQLKATLPDDLLSPSTYNAFLDNSVRNTCSTLYPMNIVTGDSTFGLSYIDTTHKNQFNDSFNYNYTNGPASASSEGVVNLNYLRNSGSNNSSSDANNTRNGFQFMSEMREHMDTHRKLLLRKEDQLSQHGYISDRYVHDDGCTSGYNRFTDQYKYKEYVYTDEDNRLCYPNGIKPEDSKNSAFGITGLGRPPHTSTTPITTVYPNQHYVSQTTGFTSGNSSIRSGKSGRSGKSSRREEALLNPSSVLGYYYNVSQATKAAHGSTVRPVSTANLQNNVQGVNDTIVPNGTTIYTSNGASINAVSTANTANNASNSITNGMTNGITNGVTNGFHRASSEINTISQVPAAYAFNCNTQPLQTNHTSTNTSATTINNSSSSTAEPAEWETELDLESDLFSFLFDPSQT